MRIKIRFWAEPHRVGRKLELPERINDLVFASGQAAWVRCLELPAGEALVLYAQESQNDGLPLHVAPKDELEEALLAAVRAQ